MDVKLEKNLMLPGKVLSGKNREFDRLNHLKRGQLNHKTLLTGQSFFSAAESLCILVS